MHTPDHSPDLKTALWIEAHVRTCFTMDLPAYVAAKGDPDRGGILLKINRFSDGVTLLERTRDFDGNRVWRLVSDTENERDIDTRIQKKRSFDEDLWVLEIEDLRNLYEPDAPILKD